MNYKIIKGHFHVVGYSPDGDSIRFQAADKNNWDYFTWKTPADKNEARKQLRFEAIDAVETHYIVILPKLFRRSTTFFQDRSDFSELADYLKQKNDKVMIRSTGQKADLADLLHINGRTIEFQCQPEDLIFDPKN